MAFVHRRGCWRGDKKQGKVNNGAKIRPMVVAFLWGYGGLGVGELGPAAGTIDSVVAKPYVRSDFLDFGRSTGGGVDSTWNSTSWAPELGEGVRVGGRGGLALESGGGHSNFYGAKRSGAQFCGRL